MCSAQTLADLAYSAEDFVPEEEAVAAADPPPAPLTHGPEEAVPGSAEEDEGVILDEVGN